MFRDGKKRIARWFWLRPVVPFVVEFVILGPLVLAATPANLIGGVAFFLPWLIVLFALINLPFVVLAFRAFHLDSATRRNHALEHATIHFLEAGRNRRFSGRATRDGFRVGGRSSPHEIKKAFEQARRIVRNGECLPYISPRCGSNLVTALGLGLLLLLSVAALSLLIQPPLIIRAGALAGVVVFFFAMRRGIGNWIQRRFFMATDFDDVSLREIRVVQAGAMDRRPVHFVATIVRTRARDAV